MRRVMIIGQPGSGKSTFARELGAITHLPVFHIDHIHWQSGWVERPDPEKDRLCAEVLARDKWIFEGGRSSAWPERLERADTLIWLDLPLRSRAWPVFWRTFRYLGRTRPDLPAGCPERFDWEFTRWIWSTRHSARERMQTLFDSAPLNTDRYHLSSPRQIRDFLINLRRAAAVGHLGISHR